MTNVVRTTGRTWEDYLLWSKLSDENEEVRVLRAVQDRQAHLRRVLTPPGTGFREEGTTFLNADQILLLTDSEVWITYRLSDPRPFLTKELERQPDNTLQLIDVPLQSAQPLRYSFLKFPEAICPEAFQETAGCCVVTQVASFLRLPEPRIEDLVDESVARRYSGPDEGNPYCEALTDELLHWRDSGVTGRTLCDIGAYLGCHVKVLDCNGECLLEHIPETRSHRMRPIYATVHGQHIWLYDSEEVLRSLGHGGARAAADSSRVELCDRGGEREEREWVELWEGEDPPGEGDFLTTDLAAFRKRLQAQGIVARVQMKSLCRPKSLAYGKIRVAQCDPEWRKHRDFCRLAGVPWGNKGIGSCVLASALNVLKPRRAAVPRAVEREAFAASPAARTSGPPSSAATSCARATSPAASLGTRTSGSPTRTRRASSSTL